MDGSTLSFKVDALISALRLYEQELRRAAGVSAAAAAASHASLPGVSGHQNRLGDSLNVRGTETERWRVHESRLDRHPVHVISKRYRLLQQALVPKGHYDMVELCDFLPGDSRKRSLYLKDIALPFRAMVRDHLVIVRDHISVTFATCPSSLAA